MRWGKRDRGSVCAVATPGPLRAAKSANGDGATRDRRSAGQSPARTSREPGGRALLRVDHALVRRPASLMLESGHAAPRHPRGRGVRACRLQRSLKAGPSRWTGPSTLPPSPRISERRKPWGRSTYPEPTMPLGSRVRNKFDLNWRPRTDLAKLIDAAWAYKRAPEHPQKGLVSGDGLANLRAPIHHPLVPPPNSQS